MSNSNPALIVGSAGGPIVAILALALVPPLAQITQLVYPWEACALVAVGGTLTYLAWRRRCRGLVGTLATLFDNTCYSSGIALAAAGASEATGIALAVVHGLMIVSFPARDYALTLLFSLSMSLPILAIIAFVQPGLPVALVLLASLAMMHLVSQETRVKRADRLRQVRLEQALGAADKLADESVQAALTTTLLTLGHFLHELRNYQTAIAANLEFVEAAGNLSSAPADALIEAQNAQRGQSELLRKTIEDLRGRSSGGTGTFLLRKTLRELAAGEREVRLAVEGEREFEVRGNSEHLKVILLNLVRNAVQAGAKQVQCRLSGDASGGAVRMLVCDDGKGIQEDKRAGLFDSFALSDKPGGSGLGLYLIRRYVELMGGTICVADESPLGGACFLIRFPAQGLGESELKPLVHQLA